jgi:hypothetical protein
LAEWLYEAGIGENRAALVTDNEIVAAQIERDDSGPGAGSIWRARYGQPLAGRRQQALVKLEDDKGTEATLSPVPCGIGPGSRFTVEVTREASRSRTDPKSIRVRVVPDDTPLREAPGLLQRISASGLPIRELRSFGPDLLEQAGWSELLEEARTGRVAFPGGFLTIHLTPAMTLIDVNGHLEPAALAVAGAEASARAINRLGLAGSIGIDLPTLAEKALRKRAADAVDQIIHGKFERSGVNGFGFLQIVRRQERPSLMQLVDGEPARAAALALLRRAERDPYPGPLALAAPPPVVASDAGAHYIDELARRRGYPASWRPDVSTPIWGSTHRPIHPAEDNDQPQ